ncbi:hypothetical protein DPMN_180979 [Dreissena polymorpha]|uniref:Uncharacterized protein n=1 Tax=Dreissena polymorpha TaxID=45954 RepID=A0A9D4DDJ8_DREPO|nr:hypothetical protein DPMN_180979 [Dreissena polymorpha]
MKHTRNHAYTYISLAHTLQNCKKQAHLALKEKNVRSTNVQDAKTKGKAKRQVINCCSTIHDTTDTIPTSLSPENIHATDRPQEHEPTPVHKFRIRKSDQCTCQTVSMTTEHLLLSSTRWSQASSRCGGGHDAQEAQYGGPAAHSYLYTESRRVNLSQQRCRKK